jgi:hypothetical protein
MLVLTFPMPSIIFTAKLKVNDDNRNFNASNDQNEENESQEAKHIIILILPHGLENEEQFHEDNRKGHDTANHNTTELDLTLDQMQMQNQT